MRRTFNVPGHAHELTFSCFRGYRFLSKDRTCRWLAESIDAARRSQEFDLWAWVFMPEHVHIIIYPRRPQYNLATIRREIKQPIARRALQHLRHHAPHWLDRVRVQKGQRATYRFWQKGAGYDRNIVEPTTLAKMIDYIHLNPVRRGLVEGATDWKWSSASTFLGGDPPPLAVDRIPPEWID